MVGDKARRFVQHGMLGLVDRRHDHGGPQTTHSRSSSPATSSISSSSTRPSTTARSRASSSASSATRPIIITVQPFPRAPPHPRATTPAGDAASTSSRMRIARAGRWCACTTRAGISSSIAGCLKLSRSMSGTSCKLRARRLRRAGGPAHPPADAPGQSAHLALPQRGLDVQREYPRAGRFRVQGLVASATGQARRARRPSAGPWRSTASFMGARRPG